jgi:hypothetical protein
MDTKSALNILTALADGVDPNTGEVLPNDSLLLNPKVIRALFTAIDAIEGRRKAEERRRTLPERTGSPWSDDEDQNLLGGFDSGTTIRDLANAHQRTQGGIEARLIKLGRINPADRRKRESWPGHQDVAAGKP